MAVGLPGPLELKSVCHGQTGRLFFGMALAERQVVAEIPAGGNRAEGTTEAAGAR